MKGTIRPCLHFVGGNASDVTGSCTIIRYDNIKLCVDMGLIQTNNIVTDYRSNREQIKKIKPKSIHGVIITHLHSDHIGGLLIASAMGMQTHIYVPQGSSVIMRIMLEDSAKIFNQDSQRLQNKHGIKAPSLAAIDDVERVMDRVVEIPFNKPTEIVGGAKLTYYHAGHIIYSAQAVIEFKQGKYVTKRIGFTGDFNTEVKSKSVPPVQPLPRCNIVVGECTYSDQKRSYTMKKDRWHDKELIKMAIAQYNKILIPTFSLQRTQDILEVLKKVDVDCPVYLDTPLGTKIYRNWCEELDYENTIGLKIIDSWEESQLLQSSNEHCIICASSGMLTAGRALSHLKTILPQENNCILFCGYSGDNTLASDIKQGVKEIKVDGELLRNNAQIYCLNTFSSHANYNQLMSYYKSIDYDKLCLVHSNFETKTTFASALQNELIKQGKSSRVVCVNQDQKIFI